MTFADALPWVAPSVTVAGCVWAFLHSQAKQHADNLARLDRFDGRLEALERNGERQTEIMVKLAEIKGDYNGLDHRVGLLESRDAARRIAAKG